MSRLPIQHRLQSNFRSMNSANNDNDRIVAGLRAGDMETFNTLYRNWFRALVAYASRIVPADKAEEAAQETMLWLWEFRETLVVRVSLKSLLFVAVRNRALNMAGRTTIRSRIYRQIASRYDAQFENPDFYLENELEGMFRDALEKLPPEFRQAFVMNRSCGKSHKEIARELGVSPQTVNYRICQALRILRVELRDFLPLLLFLLR